MNELIVKQQNGVIECNFEEIKADLETMMSAYTSLEITEDGIKDAKTDLATLRKIYKAVDDKRKDVKKDFMKPYTDFEDNVKDLLQVINKPIGMIDNKLKEFETKRIAEKQQYLKDLYEECIGEFGEYLPFEKVKKPQWDNSSITEKAIRYDLSEAVTKVRSDLDAIKGLHSEIEEECLKAYKASGNNILAAISKNTDYVNAKALAQKKLEEEKRIEEQRIEEEKRIQAEKEAAETKDSVDELKEEAAEEIVKEVEPETTVEINTEIPFFQEAFTFRVIGAEDIKLVKEYLAFAGIEYEEV